MASVLHRVTKVYIPSANTPDYPIIDWIVEPDMTAVIGFPSKYWVITGDVVTLADPAAQAVIDAAELVVTRDNTTAQLDQVETITRAFMLVMRDELNNHADKMNEIIAAASLAVSQYPQRTVAQLRSAVRGKLGN